MGDLRMNEQEIRAKSLEIAALIIGQNRNFSKYDLDDISNYPPPVKELRKYELLAALIEKDIRVGLPVQDDIKYILERYNTPELKERYNL
jgi:hypothetical protein